MRSVLSKEQLEKLADIDPAQFDLVSKMHFPDLPVDFTKRLVQVSKLYKQRGYKLDRFTVHTDKVVGRFLCGASDVEVALPVPEYAISA